MEETPSLPRDLVLACWDGCFGRPSGRFVLPHSTVLTFAQLWRELLSPPLPPTASLQTFILHYKQPAVLCDWQCSLLQKAPPGLIRVGVPPWPLPPYPGTARQGPRCGCRSLREGARRFRSCVGRFLLWEVVASVGSRPPATDLATVHWSRQVFIGAIFEANAGLF